MQMRMHMCIHICMYIKMQGPVHVLIHLHIDMCIHMHLVFCHLFACPSAGNLVGFRAVSKVCLQALLKRFVSVNLSPKSLGEGGGLGGVGR